MQHPWNPSYRSRSSSPNESFNLVKPKFLLRFAPMSFWLAYAIFLPKNPWDYRTCLTCDSLCLPNNYSLIQKLRSFSSHLQFLIKDLQNRKEIGNRSLCGLRSINIYIFVESKLTHWNRHHGESNRDLEKMAFYTISAHLELLNRKKL